jgi:hypothetical protein
MGRLSLAVFLLGVVTTSAVSGQSNQVGWTTIGPSLDMFGQVPPPAFWLGGVSAGEKVNADYAAPKQKALAPCGGTPKGR